MSGISLNKEINNVLRTDEKLKEMVGNNIYQLVAKEPVSFPFVLFGIDSITPAYCKSGVSLDTVEFYVGVASDKYNTAVDIAERVREIIELYRSEHIANTYMENATEGFENDAYFLKLTFTAKVR